MNEYDELTQTLIDEVEEFLRENEDDYNEDEMDLVEEILRNGKLESY